MTWKGRLLRVPLIGSIVHWCYSILRLGKIRHELALQLMEMQVSQRQAIQRLEHLSALNIENKLRQFDELDIGNRLKRSDALAHNIELRLNKLEEAVRSVVASDSDQDNRIAGLRQELRRHMQAIAASAATTATAAPQAVPAPTGAAGFDMDAFYLEFEGAFRGSREDIRDRLEVYLPYFEHFRGDAGACVIDVGCGRGEWLEVLKGEGLNAKGIDMNDAMVSECRERGLAAEYGDAIAYLRRQPEGSLAAVTGFHIIEHLPFESLIALFDAALHAVREDGLIIFETPNPENLVVGACNFYSDPTHLRPIVPAVAEFIARQRGFARAETLRLNAYPVEVKIAENSDVAHRVNQALYGPQDYAVIAWKTYAN